MRAFVTGAGVASAYGVGVEAFWNGLLSGVSATTGFDPGVPGCRCRVAAQVPVPAPVLGGDHLEHRSLQLARLALADALQGRPLQEPERVGLVVGSGLGPLDLSMLLGEQLAGAAPLSPLSAFQGFAHSVACNLASQFDVRGPVLTVSSGCNSGAEAIGVGLDWLRSGRVDVALVGGVEAELNPLFLASMSACRALVTSHNSNPGGASRPFDMERGGNVPGEGAAFVVLENRRDVALAELSGYANSAVGNRRAYNPFDPVFDTSAMRRNWTLAVADSRRAEKIGLVSANGSSSVFYDKLEGLSLGEDPLTQHIPVFSIKGHLGQTGAVTPVLQLVSAALAQAQRKFPGTLNCDQIEPCLSEMPLIRSVEETPSGTILCNSIGFGGFYYSSFLVDVA